MANTHDPRLRRSILDSLAIAERFAIPESLAANRSDLVDTLSRLNVELPEREFVQRGENQYGPPVTTGYTAMHRTGRPAPIPKGKRVSSCTCA